MLNPSEIDKLERQAIIAALFRICDPRRMENIKKGDTVQLKSGGPIMTVHNVDSMAFCQWFDKDGALKQGHFQPEQLKKVEPRDDDPGIRVF
jgi:uncharacterized protein YodC (DUF2158 family)